MSFTYTCPACTATLRSAKQAPAGKKITCPKCQEQFVAEPEEEPAAAAAGPGTFKLADDPGTGKKPAPAKAGPKPPEPPKSPARKMVEEDEDEESVRKGYGVVRESAEEEAEAAKHKPKFTEIQDKFKKSARGPAVSLLVMPANLLTAAGIITAVIGVGAFVIGMWPLVFNDAPPGDEEMEEAIITMLLGLMVFGWGCLVCFGASQMQEISSYTWAFMGAVMAVPLLVGIYAIVMLLNPKVKAGFEESEGGPEDEDENDKKKKDDEDEEDDED